MTIIKGCSSHSLVLSRHLSSPALHPASVITRRCPVGIDRPGLNQPQPPLRLQCEGVFLVQAGGETSSPQHRTAVAGDVRTIFVGSTKFCAKQQAKVHLRVSQGGLQMDDHLCIFYSVFTSDYLFTASDGDIQVRLILHYAQAIIPDAIMGGLEQVEGTWCWQRNNHIPVQPGYVKPDIDTPCQNLGLFNCCRASHLCSIPSRLEDGRANTGCHLRRDLVNWKWQEAGDPSSFRSRRLYFVGHQCSSTRVGSFGEQLPNANMAPKKRCRCGYLDSF
ncbi:hypothetical protein CPAR01_03871 [Colletotrichum paranaense]|uniref:Uncharacterized protein n=1 Tax=Colletotrichum paranaense TaxID=1914294 RepID=A0ABQ9SUP8_9PEZI|nr:uncharacterized protein CPAR01_03871 [Colletotrichum paranaense]KAK1543238.1 hypothetical protein CPAR01_03871 [Colletotrichum paranaense]